MSRPSTTDPLTAAEHARAAGPCLTCMAVALAVLLAIVASFAYLGADYRGLFSAESMRLMTKFVAEFFPPDVSAAFLAKTGWAGLQTLAVSAVGTLVALLFGAALALPAAGRFGSAARAASRLLLNVLRSVPELVWRR